MTKVPFIIWNLTLPQIQNKAKNYLKNKIQIDTELEMQLHFIYLGFI